MATYREQNELRDVVGRVLGDLVQKSGPLYGVDWHIYADASTLTLVIPRSTHKIVVNVSAKSEPLVDGLLKSYRPEEGHCRVCDVELPGWPTDNPYNGVCEEHCPDHDYQYEPSEGHMCVHCGARPPDDWYDD